MLEFCIEIEGYSMHEHDVSLKVSQAHLSHDILRGDFKMKCLMFSK